MMRGLRDTIEAILDWRNYLASGPSLGDLFICFNFLCRGICASAEAGNHL